MKQTVKAFGLFAAVVILSISAFAQHPIKSADGHNINVDKDGVMALGYDVVAMFLLPDQTIKGSAEFQSTFQGAKYYFSSADNKKLFDATPAKYAPAFGGYCAIAAAQNNLRPVQIWTHSIVNGTLVLNHNAHAKELWEKNKNKNFKKAVKNWPALNAKDPKYNIIKAGETQESLAETSYEGKKQ